MKTLFLSLFACAAMVSAQAPATAPDSDPVVAVVEGKAWRKSEIERLVLSLPAQVQRNFTADKRAFLKTLAVMTRLANIAESEGLDKQDPHFFRLQYNRNLYLAQVRIEAQNARQAVMPEDQKKYYEERKAEFAEAVVKVLFLGFNDNPPAATDPKAAKPMRSAEAEKLAVSIVAQARAGKDFVQLVKQHSQDADSKAKDGDFPPIKPTDNALPAQIKSAVFALKPGEVTDPVRQPGGFWILKLVEHKTPTYDEVKDQIFTAIQEGRVRQWMETVQKEAVVEFKDQKYLDDKSLSK